MEHRVRGSVKLPMRVSIGGRAIGPGAPCFIVAEAGSSHGGDLTRGLELIDAAAQAGADCVKLQIIYADEIVHPLTGSIELPGGSVPIYERFRALERDRDFYARMKENAERRGIVFLASVFGLKSAHLLRELGAAAVKIASPELNHFPLLAELRSYGLPVILSTGVSTLGDIERALAACSGLTGSAAVLLHCITAYPAPEGEYNLRTIPSLQAVFGRPVGVSDHSLDPLLVPGLAVAVGACVVEKHLTLSAQGGGLDDPIALDPQAFARLAAGIRELEAMEPAEALASMEERYGRERIRQVLGDGVKRLAPSEERFYLTTNRSLHALTDIEAGEVIAAEKLCIVRSEKNLRPGLDPSFCETITGCVAQRRIPAGEGITWEDLLPRSGSQHRPRCSR